MARAGETRPGRRVDIDLSLLCQDAVMSAQMIDPNRTTGFTTPGISAPVVGDPDRLRQVVDNLLANVRAHTPPGSHATVRTAVTPSAAGSNVTLTVCDDGPGFPPGALDDVPARG